MGGVGKTNTALEYSYSFGHQYQAVFWVQAGTSVELTKSYEAIANKLRLRDALTPQSSAGDSQDLSIYSGVELARE
ncbi:hypothetical protein PG994_001502 [Apiospora phragmitis]|uniref:NB-ARC domain-containing protein n=1 Tax=Apiospora phragmitis TaxID=2905665 RepID=A0ABR1WTR4_9PEZI